MKKSTLSKLMLVVLFFFLSFYLKSEGTNCKEICTSTVLPKTTKIVAHQQYSDDEAGPTLSYPPYYPFFIEI
jgi:hypothetical protein